MLFNFFPLCCLSFVLCFWLSPGRCSRGRRACGLLCPWGPSSPGRPQAHWTASRGAVFRWVSPGAYILFRATTGILLFSRPHRGKVNRYDLALALTVGLNMFSSWHSYVCVEIIRKPTYFLFNVFRGQSQSRTHFISGANFRLATLHQRFALEISTHDSVGNFCWLREIFY